MTQQNLTKNIRLSPTFKIRPNFDQLVTLGIYNEIRDEGQPTRREEGGCLWELTKIGKRVNKKGREQTEEIDKPPERCGLMQSSHSHLQHG